MAPTSGSPLRGVTPEPPFRWNVKKREQLGGAVGGLDGWISFDYVRELVVCSARVVALCGDGELFFVGRSPDDLFDLLSGVFVESSWEERIRLLPVSLKWGDDVNERPEVRDALRRYLARLDLAPDQINHRPRPTVLVDIVAEGRTFGELVTTWRDWSADLRVPWVQVRRKIRLIGITIRTQTSPKAWRWHQHVPWVALLPKQAIKNVSVPWYVWNGLATRAKMSQTFPPEVWADPDVARRPGKGASAGLREAVFVFDCGRSAPVRERFVAELLSTQNVRLPAVRTLAHEIRARPHASPDVPFAASEPHWEPYRLGLARRFRETLLGLPLSPWPQLPQTVWKPPKPPPTTPDQESPSGSPPTPTSATPD